MFTKTVIAVITLLCVFASDSHASDVSPGWHIRGMIELQIANTDSLNTWQNNGMGKFRFDDTDDNEIKIGSSGVDLSYSFSTTSTVKGSVLYNHDNKHEFAVTELFWHYRPVPASAWRNDYKVGSFYPPMSLENTSLLWTSSFSITPSVINSWIGEELRTIGVQGQWTHQGRYSGSPHDITLTAAIFAGNDPTGALLAWRGWARTDRQTGLDQAVSTPELPTFVPGGMFAQQNKDIAPFLEIDNRPGFYLGSGWRYQRRLKVAALYYDNQADPSLLERGQYGWRTKFGHLSLRWVIADNWLLLSQWIDGRTIMGPSREVDAAFNAAYIMLVNKWNRHRFSVQLEDFSVDDDDQTYRDNNQEQGSAATVAWRYRLRKHWQLSSQLTYMESERAARMYFGENSQQYETQLLFSGQFVW